MKYRPLLLIIIISLLLGVIGCGGKTNLVVLRDKMPPTLKIVGVKYKSGEYTKFINHDAVYERAKDRIWGQVTGGKDIYIKLQDLGSIRVEDFSKDPSENYFLTVSEFKELF